MSLTHYKELIDTNYLGQWDFKRGPDGRRRKYVVEIAKVERYKAARQRTKIVAGRKVTEPNKRIEITFAPPAKKHWLAGPVSLDAMAKMFGPNVENWVGKKITLYVDEEITFGRVTVGGVRCEPIAAHGPVSDEGPEGEVEEEVAQRIADAFGDEP